jgi:hypothetical protein
VIGGFFYEINYITTDNKYNKNGEQTISFYVLDDVGDVLPCLNIIVENKIMFAISPLTNN